MDIILKDWDKNWEPWNVLEHAIWASPRTCDYIIAGMVSIVLESDDDPDSIFAIREALKSERFLMLVNECKTSLKELDDD